MALTTSSEADQSSAGEWCENEVRISERKFVAESESHVGQVRMYDRNVRDGESGEAVVNLDDEAVGEEADCASPITCST